VAIAADNEETSGHVINLLLGFPRLRALHSWVACNRSREADRSAPPEQHVEFEA